LPPNGICQVENSLCVQVLRSPILSAYATRAVGVSQTLRRGTRKGITELSLLVVSPIFCKAAITLGVGLHSSFYNSANGIPVKQAEVTCRRWLALYAGMQFTDVGLAPLVNCPVCPVTDDTDGTVSKMRPGPARPRLEPGRILDQTQSCCYKPS